MAPKPRSSSKGPAAKPPKAAKAGKGTVRGDLDACRTLDLPVIRDARGNLTFIEQSVGLPFPIRRVYYLYDVPGGAERGGHAHFALNQLILPLAGSFDVVLDDGQRRRTVHLNRPWTGVLVGPMIWRELQNFSSGSVCLVLASEPFDEADYIRDHGEFVRLAARPARRPSG